MTFAEQESGFFARVAAPYETKPASAVRQRARLSPPNVNYQWALNPRQLRQCKYGSKAEIVELASYAGTDVTGKKSAALHRQLCG